jgi:hypothetical protein
MNVKKRIKSHFLFRRQIITLTFRHKDKNLGRGRVVSRKLPGGSLILGFIACVLTSLPRGVGYFIIPPFFLMSTVEDPGGGGGGGLSGENCPGSPILGYPPVCICSGNKIRNSYPRSIFSRQ